MLPQSSVTVQVLVYVPATTHAPPPVTNEPLVFTRLVTSASQPSNATGKAACAAAKPAVLAQSKVTFKAVGAVVQVGACVSAMVNVALVVLLLPQSSVAVKMTVAEPVAPHKSLNAVKLFVHVTPLHASVAAAPPLLDNHAANADVLPLPSHSTVLLDACVPIVGACVSAMVNVALVVLLLPQSSVAVKMTVAEPVAPHKSLTL
ncbi:MAG: hypothetical protein IPP48_13460 [Chitinophagaceae bacterium]|nr:hypothetical protein [Chitinophagaceae bacterium]